MKRISPHIQTADLTVQMFYLVTALVESLGFVNIKGLGAIGKDAVLLLTFSLSGNFFLFVDTYHLKYMKIFNKHPEAWYTS